MIRIFLAGALAMEGGISVRGKASGVKRTGA
jgi:hypothetical protein